MTVFILHSKSQYLPFGTLPFPNEVAEILDVLVVTAMKISVSVLHGDSFKQFLLTSCSGSCIAYRNNKYLTETKEISNTTEYFLQI
jgi:hypothetical protein